MFRTRGYIQYKQNFHDEDVRTFIFAKSFWMNRAPLPPYHPPPSSAHSESPSLFFLLLLGSSLFSSPFSFLPHALYRIYLLLLAKYLTAPLFSPIFFKTSAAPPPAPPPHPPLAVPPLPPPPPPLPSHFILIPY